MRKAHIRIKNAISTLGFSGIANLIKIKIVLKLLKKRGIKTYAQMYEDYFLDRFLKFKKSGFYIDIGANDPDKLNNTKLFYLKDWRGINIEPNVHKYEDFIKDRPHDINVNMGVGKKNEIIDFYNFNENVYSTFSKEDVDKRVEKGYKIIDVKKVEIDRLENIIAKYLPKYTDIDFMSIDTEGLDLIVLQSNNWKKYRPSFICVEIMEFGSNMIKRNKEIDSFLCSVKYKEVFFNGLNSIYKDIIKS